MAAKKILIYPHPKLRQKCGKVAKVDKEIREHFDNLKETLVVAEGIGLAAPQIGLEHRLVVICPELNPHGDEAICLANPQLLERDGEREGEEGCLSLPGMLLDVRRAARVKVGYLDYHNRAQTIEGEGMLAVCLQHEMDHLDGTLIFDKISPTARRAALKTWRKSQKRR